MKAQAGVQTAAAVCWILDVGWSDRTVGLGLSLPSKGWQGPGEAWRGAYNRSSSYVA